MFLQEGEHRNIVGGVIFKIGVLDQNVVSASLPNPPLDCAALALVSLGNQTHRREPLYLGRGSVLRTVVHHNDFLRKADGLSIYPEDPLQQRSDKSLLIVGGNNNRHYLHAPSPAAFPKRKRR